MAIEIWIDKKIQQKLIREMIKLRIRVPIDKQVQGFRRYLYW